MLMKSTQLLPKEEALPAQKPPKAPLRGVPLLRQVLAYIDAHPDQYDQATYGILRPCGSSFCVAGHAMLLSGYRTELLSPSLSTLMFIRPDGKKVSFANTRTPSDEGACLLQLTPRQAAELFSSCNTRAEVQTIAERIALSKGEVL